MEKIHTHKKLLIIFVFIIGISFAHNAFSQSATDVTKQHFTSNGTFTVPTGVSAVWVALSGGGGGGGGCANGCNTGGGNGGAGGTNVEIVYVKPGDVLEVVVGKGGDGGGANATGNGTGGGGGGGGASAVYSLGGSSNFKIIAGGGGGGGGAHNADNTDDNRYGVGGAGGTNGGGGGGGGGYGDGVGGDVGGNGGYGGFPGGGGGGAGIKKATGGSGGATSGIISAGGSGIPNQGGYGGGGAPGGGFHGDPNTRMGGNGGEFSTGFGFQNDSSITAQSSRGGAGALHDDNGYRYDNGSGCGYKSSCYGSDGIVDIYYSPASACPNLGETRNIFTHLCFSTASPFSCLNGKVYNPTSNSCTTPIYVGTDDADGITQTSAVLRGEGGINQNLLSGCTSSAGYSTTTGEVCSSEGDASALTSKMTAYFRYSQAAISPIFCNDIYGTNMLSTKDINLGTASSASFYQRITNLIPDTTYYYCAIISNGESIAYGGTSTVKSFRTSPLDTTIQTKNVTNITSTSVVLNGSYSSVKDVTTYFRYEENISESCSYILSKGGTCPSWQKVGEQAHLIGNSSNLNGNINFTLTGLKPSTNYVFMAMADDSKIFTGSTLNFTTSSSDNNGEGGVTCTFPEVPDASGNCVNPNSSTLFPIVTVTASPSSVSSGGTSTISWTSTNVTSCNASVPSYQSTDHGPTGHFSTGPLSNSQSYSVLCTGANGTISGNVYVYVTTIGTLGGSTLFPIVTVTASPSSVSSGGTSTISWTSTNTTSCAENGVSAGTSGSFSTGTLGNSTSYSITCTGVNGTNSGSAYVYVTNSSSDGGVCTNCAGNSNYPYNPNTSTPGNNNGIINTNNTTPFTLGQTATPPVDDVVHYHEGIETVFARQIVGDTAFATMYGYQAGTDLQTFAANLADQFAKAFGYVSPTGKEIRVSQPDVAAYQLELIGSKLTVYEYYNNKIVDIRNVTTVFKNAAGYEYYFTK